MKYDCLRYSLSALSTINTAKIQISTNIPREDSDISLSNSYLELHFDVLRNDQKTRYVVGADTRLVKFGSIASFNFYHLATSSGKHLKEACQAHIVSLLFKLLTSAAGTDDMFIEFDCEPTRRQDDLNDNENVKGIYHLRILLKDIFRFAEHQQKATNGLGYILRLTRNFNIDILDKAAAPDVVVAKTVISGIDWYVPHSTRSKEQQAFFCWQVLSKTPRELHKIQRTVFMKVVNTQSLPTFDLRYQEGINVPV